MKKTLLFFILSAMMFCRTQAQTILSDSIYHDAQYREYLLYVPAMYDGSHPVPLVLNLHGYSSTNLQQLYYGDFMPIADTANFLILLPNGTIDEFGFHFWNCFGVPGIGVDDVAFISDLIDTIEAAYNIDENSVYSTGMSNGGFMSYELACQLSGRIAAIASVCGSMVPLHMAACDPQHTTPAMEIHGTSDPTVPYDGNTSFLSIDSVMNYWAHFNHCSFPPSITPVPDIVPTDGCTAEHDVFGATINSVTTELFKIYGGEHTWPGAFIPIGVTNQDINASAEIWKFFRRYKLNEVTAVQNISPEKNKITVYPDPCTDYLQVISGAEQITGIEIFDMTGRRIPVEFLSEDAHILNTENLSKGIYSLVVFTETGHSTAAFIKK